MQQPLPPRSHGGLVFKVVFVYFLTLITLLWITHKNNLLLYDYDGYFKVLNVWGILIVGLIYVVPFAMAFAVSLQFRRFWNLFAAIVLSIFIVHGLYSLLMVNMRFNYLNDWNKEVASSSTGSLDVRKFAHKLYDDNSNGLIDRMEFRALMDTSSLADGNYVLRVHLSQDGFILPGGETIHAKVLKIRPDQKKQIILKFAINPQRYKLYFDQGPANVDIELKKRIAFGTRGKKILSLSRWAPLMKKTDWDSVDPQIFPDEFTIEYKEGAYVFAFIKCLLSTHFLSTPAQA